MLQSLVVTHWLLHPAAAASFVRAASARFLRAHLAHVPSTSSFDRSLRLAGDSFVMWARYCQVRFLFLFLVSLVTLLCGAVVLTLPSFCVPLVVSGISVISSGLYPLRSSRSLWYHLPFWVRPRFLPVPVVSV